MFEILLILSLIFIPLSQLLPQAQHGPDAALKPQPNGQDKRHQPSCCKAASKRVNTRSLPNTSSNS